MIRYVLGQLARDLTLILFGAAMGSLIYILVYIVAHGTLPW